VVNLEWAHALAALVGAAIGAASAIFGFGWRMGRIEGRLKLYIREEVSTSEKRIEEKVQESSYAFDETLKGLRQKINDVELNSERRYLPKEEFNDFRLEYREDMRDLKRMISNNP
jgi:hypothetical protein